MTDNNTNDNINADVGAKMALDSIAKRAMREKDLMESMNEQFRLARLPSPYLSRQCVAQKTHVINNQQNFQELQPFAPNSCVHCSGKRWRLNYIYPHLNPCEHCNLKNIDRMGMIKRPIVAPDPRNKRAFLHVSNVHTT